MTEADDRFDVRLATPADEPDVRALVGSTAMPGAVAIRFAREPDYFHGTSIMGDPCDVVVVRDRTTGRLAGFGCRAERRAFVNGREERIGYIGQIRAAPGYRGRWLAQRAMAWLRASGGADLLYCGVVARENPRAREVLVGRRPPGSLRRIRLGGLTTCAILLRPRRPPRIAGLDVAPARIADIEEVVAFLRREGPRRQLFPAYSVEEFIGGRTLRGLAPDDVAVARRGGAIVGVMAAWDQAAYKQDVVDGYGTALRRLRPAYDLLARALGARPLTPPGEAIPLDFAACTCVAGDDPVVMQALLAASAARALSRGKAFLMVGLADDDPLLAVARSWLHVTYRSDVFALSWAADPGAILDGRVPYIEIATL
jgi:ribosomal protein S18 acetylase RimI-like enzyme